MKIELFHLIADVDSAEVRRALVATGFSDQTQFRNTAYETHAEALVSLAGENKVPCLLIDSQTLVKGKSAILDWIQKTKNQ